MTPTAMKLVRMRDRGLIGEDLLLLYGISGSLPSHDVYSNMSPEERRHFIQSRMQERFGPQWQELFETLPPIFGLEILANWPRDGF